MHRAARRRIITITMTMSDPSEHPPAGLLHLLAWLSPGFPTGAFACSHGLECAIEDGDIGDEASLLIWLEDVLRHGSGRTDAILLRHAHRAARDPARLAELAELAAATAPSRERRSETIDLGTAFAAAAAPWSPPDLPPAPPYPIALGALAGAHGIDPDAVTAAHLQAFAANLISAAVRLVPLGQSAGLRVLAALESAIREVAAATRTATLDEIGSAAFRSDLAAMRHETLYTRLFRT